MSVEPTGKREVAEAVLIAALSTLATTGIELLRDWLKERQAKEREEKRGQKRRKRK